MVDLKRIKPQYLWYVIGLIATDGCLSKDGRHICITSKDGEYLNSVKKALGLKIKIGKKAREKTAVKKYFILQFSDVSFYDFLLDIGLTPCKSLTMGEIKINKRYFIDFLRGVIDGDGHINTWINNKNAYRQWSLRIASAAPVFIEWLKEEVENYFQVRGKLYCYLHKGKKNNIYTLKFGKLAAKVITKNIYYKNSLCLNRKNRTKINLLKDESKMINYAGVICPGAEIGIQSRLKIE